MVQTFSNQNFSNVQISIQGKTERLEDCVSKLVCVQEKWEFTWDKLKENEENDKILQESSIKLNQKYLEMFEKVVFLGETHYNNTITISQDE